MPQAAEILILKQALEQRFPNALPISYRTAGAVPTGVGALDHMLPAGGLPRGRLSIWKPGGGASAILGAACEAVAQRGERAAWIDAAGTIAGDSWRAGPLLLKPEGELESLICAEELLRCGAFGLIVLSGTRAAFNREDVRLSRAVREGGGAFVALAEQSNVAHLQVVSHIDPAGYRWQTNPFGEPAHVTDVRVQVEAQAMGWSGRAQVILPVRSFEQRSAVAKELVDRRGARHVNRKLGDPALAVPRPVLPKQEVQEAVKVFRATSY
jgi:hypothetical protein